MIPIPKKVSDDKNAKFSPIVITSPFLKTIGKLLLLAFQSKLKENIDPYQLVHKCERSTSDASDVLHHNIVFSLERGKKYVRYAILNYTSVFDSVPRSLLINKFARVNTDNWFHLPLMK